MKAAILLLTLSLASQSIADEASAIATLEQSVKSPSNLRVNKNDDGQVIGIRVNAPGISNEELDLFNELPHLETLTISHAGYGPEGKTGVDFSGVSQLSEHPSLRYFSAGGAVGKEYLAALAELTNVPELYVQTTNSVDADWAPIGTMKHLTYLGIRVRNNRMNSLTSGFLEHLMPLENLERFLLSEMTFEDAAPFVKFVTSRPNLSELTIRRCELSDSALSEIRAAKPDLEIVIKD